MKSGFRIFTNKTLVALICILLFLSALYIKRPVYASLNPCLPLPSDKGQSYNVTVLGFYSKSRNNAPHSSYISRYVLGKGANDYPYIVMDISVARGTPVYAVESGKIYQNNNHSSGGYNVVIWHDKDGSYSYYGHLMERSHKTKGAEVKRGELIGYTGNSGGNGTKLGYHLHFEWSGHDPYCEFLSLGYNLKISPNSGASQNPHTHETPITNPASHAHDYDELGKCKNGGEQFQLNIVPVSKSMVTARTNGSDVPCHSTPYGAANITRRLAAKGAAVSIKSQTKNAFDNLWYQTTSGDWIVSDYLNNEGHDGKLELLGKGASSITTTTARVDATCLYAGTRPSSVGLYLGESTSSMSKKGSDTIGHNKNPFEIWYNLTGLSSGTKYYYKFYAVVDGKETLSDTYNFTTAPAAQTPSTPVITAEATSDGRLAVELSCSTSGVTMYWTSNGSTPTTSSSIYSATSFPGSRTIKAIAVKDGKSSNVSSKSFYIVPLDANGGSFGGSSYRCYEPGSAYTNLPTPTRSGYTFSGWYTSKTGGTPVTSLRVDNDNTLYAQWQSVSTTQPSPTEPTQTTTKYRTRKLETIESENSKLSGWEFKEPGKVITGAWSDWVETPLYTTPTEEVGIRTRQETTTKTVYNYYHYTYTKNGQQWTTYSKNPGSGITTKYATKQLDSQLPKLTLSDNTYTAYGTRAEWWYRVDNGCPSAPGGSFETKVATGSKTITEYRSRPMIQYYIHTRWGNWSDWKTGTPPAASSTLQVEVIK